ncbi:hypothetical protein vseg_000663 [Gypsophila vaccaria]
MQLFSWVQNKLSGNQSISKPPHIIHPCHKREHKEEFSDWPNGFLSIGTLFNKSVKDDSKDDHNDAKENDQKLTSDEVIQLQKELNALILSTDLDCLSSFEAENDSGLSSNAEGRDQEETDEQNYTIVLNSSVKDVCFDSKNSNAIRKKSLSFILKKMFVCGGGFGPTYSLRDPTMLPPTSRMNKILRALLRKKIYPQTHCPRNKSLESRQAGRSNLNDDDDNDDNFYLEGSDSSKWVKTDTEYIVLEI